MNKKVLSAVLLVVFVLVYLLRDILFPFVVGIGLAYFFDPMTCYFEKKLKSRTWAVSLIFVLSTLIVLIALLIIVPLIKKQVVLLADNLQGYLDILWAKAEPVLAKLRKISPHTSDNMRESVNGHVSSISKFVITSVQRILSGSYVFINFLSLAVITPVVAFYLMCDWNDFCGKIKGLLPVKSADVILNLYHQMDSMLSGFIRGQAMVCGCLGLFYAIGLSIAGLDFGVLLGLFIGSIAFIPFVGSGLGFILSMTMGVIQFEHYTSLIGVLVVFSIGQILEGYVLTPKLVGDKVGLHPVWVMFALLAGGVLFGFLGVVLALPIAALIGVLVRFFVDEYKKSDIYLG